MEGKEIETGVVGSYGSTLLECQICRHKESTQEAQVGKKQNIKSLERHEKDFRVYSVGNRECSLLKIVGWGRREGEPGLL